MSYTKGKWEFDKESWTIRVKEWKNCQQMGNYKGCIICGFEKAHGNRNHAFKETEANARLIASAPDLLEACKSALDIFANDIHSGKKFFNGENSAIFKLQQATEKAESK